MALHVKDVSESFIKDLAQEYLKDFATMAKLAKKYGSTPGTISNILFRGVVEGIIDEVSAEAIANKATCNTDNIRRTDKRWKQALNMRETNIIKEEIQFLNSRLEQVSFQIETYDDYFFDDDSAPSKKTLRCEQANLKAQISQLEKRLRG